MHNMNAGKDRAPRVMLCIALALAGCAGPVSEADGTSARIHHDIGIANLDRGELRLALRELLRAVELDPELAATHNALGLVYHAMGRSKEALHHYERAVALQPRFSEAHNNLGVLLIDLGRYEDAIVHLKAAIADILYATPALAEGNLGFAYYKNGEVDLGLQHLRNAVAQSPKFCRGYLWLARIGLETHNAADIVVNARRFAKYCVEDREISQKLDPEHVREMNYYLGSGYLELGDRAQAAQAFAACASPDNAGAFGQKCEQARRALARGAEASQP